MAFDPWGGVWATSLADQVYAWLRAAVQDGTLARGQKVTERELAARLGVSPTPVREALRQLIHERVVVRTGPRSLQIARYDPETLNECAESLARVMAILARFHQRIESAAGNPVMEALLAQSRVFSRDGRLHRTIERIDSRPERFIRRYREHQALLDAIAEGDEERADHLAYTHHVTAARRRRTPRP
ncbi:GntR family transcriptional regulator [Nonomuraea fuscirosea]|uniref:GntR family transcriptional regulator n=1 Tax=Nonomuraea fuscirosea TaxID=1291556 RepID=UPI002DDAAB82|nr:GntR family transcriptional regulator [Nonomuraea fuscirosea]